MERLNYDLCVVGAGASGCACTYIAAKLGLKTVLIDKNNYLGGLMTGGLVVPFMKTDSGGRNTEFMTELIRVSKLYNSQIEYFDGNQGWLNPNVLKIVLDKMMLDVGADVIFECAPKNVYSKDGMVKNIEFESNFLSIQIESKYYLDSTGDSKIFKLLNEEFYNHKAKKQSSSLRFIMAGVDIKKLKNFLLEHDNDFNVTNFTEYSDSIQLTTAYTWDTKKWNLKPLFDTAINNGDLEPFDSAYFQIFTVAGANGSVAFNCPRLRDFDYNNPIDYSNAIRQARGAIWRISSFVKKYFAGFENAYISQIADLTGNRETNKIIAKHQMLYSDMFEPLDEPVLCGNYPIDIHSNDKDSSSLISTDKYYLGIDSLISKNYSNLFAAGRNLGADNKVQSAMRIIPSCMSMGEGVARHVRKLC